MSDTQGGNHFFTGAEIDVLDAFGAAAGQAVTFDVAAFAHAAAGDDQQLRTSVVFQSGIIVGAFTGYYGGILDEVVMRLNDVLNSFPSILLSLVFVSLLGPGKKNVVIALGLLFIPSFARITRSEFVRIKNLDYVKCARLEGVPSLRIMFVHILPNAVNTLLSTTAIGFNNAVLAEASLSFLGIGVQPPDPSLGSMLAESQTYLFSAPWYTLSAGRMIILLILGFGLLSDGLGDIE